MAKAEAARRWRATDALDAARANALISILERGTPINRCRVDGGEMIQMSWTAIRRSTLDLPKSETSHRMTSFRS